MKLLLYTLNGVDKKAVHDLFLSNQFFFYPFLYMFVLDVCSSNTESRMIQL